MADGAVWNLTPKEFYRALIVWREREFSTVNRDITLAWRVANLSRAKEIPELATLLVRDAVKTERTERQTPEQMKTMLHVLSEQYGLKLRTGKAKFHG